MKANFDDKDFILAVKNAKLGDILEEEFAKLKVVGIYGEEVGEYEERLSPTVLIRKRCSNGVLLKKIGSNALIFVPNEVLN